MDDVRWVDLAVMCILGIGAATGLILLAVAIIMDDASRGRR